MKQCLSKAFRRSCEKKGQHKEKGINKESGCPSFNDFRWFQIVAAFFVDDKSTLDSSEKVYLDASQFDHKGPLKIDIEPEVKLVKDVGPENDQAGTTHNAEKHFTFGEQHEVYDIGPDVEVVA
ncbi:hypothetical protein Tcan_07414 [Toxocara canis]|uniref:Uncharacterized protein n=1 Tax=Toxocara canis TaxID=6265 RepID=A0A0B2W430_TOXCA|nr:hypothetical protein Tcan_07414 [Toxocara canis]